MFRSRNIKSRHCQSDLRKARSGTGGGRMRVFERSAVKLGKLLAQSGYAMSSEHRLIIGFETEQQNRDAHSALAEMLSVFAAKQKTDCIELPICPTCGGHYDPSFDRPCSTSAQSGVKGLDDPPSLFCHHGLNLAYLCSSCAGTDIPTSDNPRLVSI
jgi:hypothetical protein